ncbi:MAG: hypothetical protein Rubg2KO_13530 [Rubricoccaceae bacterium]
MSARLRPRFEFVAPRPPDEALERLRAALAGTEAPCRGRVFSDHAVLYVLHAEERVWSPFLSLDIGSHPDGTLIRGLFGPKPAVWSLFVASYAACVFGALGALGFAYAQWTLGQSPWALGLLPVAVLGALITYGFARYGQHQGRDQMNRLRSFLDGSLDAPPPAPGEPERAEEGLSPAR